MSEPRSNQDRASLLADIAEMYYFENRNQAEIAKKIGVTRSMISRMLTEAREAGIVEIRVHRALQSDRELENELAQRFELEDVYVLSLGDSGVEQIVGALGRAGAAMLKRYLAPKKILGLAWGTSISATVDALEVSEPIPMRVVQLIGAMGARNLEYDGHDLVSRLSEKLGGESYYLNAPYICQDAEMAKSLLGAKGVKETIALGKKANIALLGVGTTSSEYSSFYLAGYITRAELDELRYTGAVGDVCGLHFDVNGKPTAEEFSNRLVSIRRSDLLSIPIRLVVAGGPGKAEAILGALRGKYINILVTDNITARKVLDLAKTK